MNKEILEAKLKELRLSHEAGMHKMRELEQQRRELEATLLRISGAVQALEELQSELES